MNPQRDSPAPHDDPPAAVVDTAAIRERTLANYRAGAPSDMAAVDIAALCNEIDVLRERVEWSRRAEYSERAAALTAETEVRRLRARLAEVEAERDGEALTARAAVRQRDAAEQMLADVQREHARAWRDEVRPNLGPVSGEGG